MIPATCHCERSEAISIIIRYYAAGAYNEIEDIYCAISIDIGVGVNRDVSASSEVEADYVEIQEVHCAVSVHVSTCVFGGCNYRSCSEYGSLGVTLRRIGQ